MALSFFIESCGRLKNNQRDDQLLVTDEGRDLWSSGLRVGGKVILREFFTEEGKIIDDGFQEEDLDDLTDVTERIYIQENARGYLDFETGDIKWLYQKKVWRPMRGGKIVREEFFDQEGDFLYELFYEYDQKGRLTYQTDQLGPVGRDGI